MENVELKFACDYISISHVLTKKRFASRKNFQTEVSRLKCLHTSPLPSPPKSPSTPPQPPTPHNPPPKIPNRKITPVPSPPLIHHPPHPHHRIPQHSPRQPLLPAPLRHQQTSLDPQPLKRPRFSCTLDPGVPTQSRDLGVEEDQGV